MPVDTEYQLYILSHQHVKKLNANDYSTEMSGLKFKLAHEREDKESWSAKAPTQRKHLIQFLRNMADQLEKEPIRLTFEYDGKEYTGEAVPILETCADDVCHEADVSLNDEDLGIIPCRQKRLEDGLCGSGTRGCHWK